MSSTTPHWVWCLLDVPHHARLSRFCRGRPRPCSRRLPARVAVFVFSSEFPTCVFVDIDINLRYFIYLRKRAVQKSIAFPQKNEVDCSNPGALSFHFFFVPVLFKSYLVPGISFRYRVIVSIPLVSCTLLCDVRVS